MSPEDFKALVDVLHRRLHNTRDPELQALLWQFAEYCDGITAQWLSADRFLREVGAVAERYHQEKE